MNNCTLMGRLTAEPELRRTQANTPVMSFTIAANRRGRDAGTDFIPCVAWEKTAEFITQWFHKGSMIAVTGALQSRTYEKDGKKHTVIELVVREADFTGEKKEESTGVYVNPSEAFDEVDDDGSLPF